MGSAFLFTAMTNPSRSHVEALIHEMVSQALEEVSEAQCACQEPQADTQLDEGLGSFVKSIKSGLGFAAKLAWLQQTQGPAAVSEELLGKMDEYLKKLKSSGKVGSVGQALYSQLEQQVEEVKQTRREYLRDKHGRFAKKM